MESRKMGIVNLDGREEGETSSLNQSQVQDPAEVGAETELGQGQGSKVNEAFVNHLPPEILMDIFKCVDTRSLLNCRLVSQKWSEISSEILLQRSDAKITFTLEDGQFYQQGATKNQKETSFNNFLMCMQESENCPFSRFVFFVDDTDSSSVYSDFFGHKDWTRFLSVVDESHQNQNQRVKIKSLEMEFQVFFSPFEPLIENLRDLLNKIPHLEEFGLSLSQMWFENHPEVKLFPETVQNIVVQLAHLKTIHFNQSMTFQFPGILKDILGAAVNLKKIYLYKSSPSFFTEIYNFLQPLGKFHLLKSFEIHINDKFLLHVKERPGFTDALFKLQLEELELDVDYQLDVAHVPHATMFLSSFFEANKNSLKKLRMSPLRILPSLRFPTFKNLTDLKLKDPRLPQHIFFPRGVRSLDIFPAVRELDLPKCDWYAAFPQLDSIPVFPRVPNLHVNDSKFTHNSVRVFSLLCPNLKHLKIHRDTNSDSAPNIIILLFGRSIWTHLKSLEFLEIDILTTSSGSNAIALDSWFTGISLENCRRLGKMMEAKKTLENSGSQTKSESSESELTAEREYPSILDMTNLKALKINAYTIEVSCLKMLKSEEFFSEKLTWISEEFAFKFLPHLKPQPTPNPEPTEET